VTACARLAVVILATVAAVTLAACGSTVSTGSYKGASKAVAQRISDFQSDVANNSPQKLCSDDLASAVQKRLQVAGSNCRTALKQQLGSIDDYELTVESIAVHNSTATAHVKSTRAGKAHIDTLRFVKEGGAWKISGVDG
jgi:hypothetical protein